MKISRSNLVEALSIVKPGLSNKDIIEQATSFAFVDGRVMTYNDEISISHPIEGIEIEGAIKAEEIYGLLSKITKDEIELSLNDDELNISSGRVKAGLRLESEIHLPIREIPEKLKKLKDPKEFIDRLAMTLQACSSDMTESKLICVSLYPDGLMIGSDGFRIIYNEGSPIPIKGNLLLPATAAAELIKIKPIKLAIDKGWLFTENAEGTIFSARYVDDSYIDLTQIQNILKVRAIEEVEFPENVLEMLERVRPFSKRGYVLDEMVDVKISKGKLILRAQAEETGSWVEERCKIKTKAEIEFGMTPALFDDILRKTKTFELDESMNKVKFKGDSWQYLIMLRRR